MAEKVLVVCRLSIVALQQILVSIFDPPGKKVMLSGDKF